MHKKIKAPTGEVHSARRLLQIMQNLQVDLIPKFKADRHDMYRTQTAKFDIGVIHADPVLIALQIEAPASGQALFVVIEAVPAANIGQVLQPVFGAHVHFFVAVIGMRNSVATVRRWG